MIADRITSLIKKFRIYNTDDIFLIGEINAYATALQMIAEKLEVLEREGFIPTAQDYGITEKEHYLDPVECDLSLEERRARLIKMLSSDENDFTVEGIKKLLSYYPATFTIREYPFVQAIVIDVVKSQWVSDNLEFLTRSISKFIPAHLDFQLSVIEE